MNPLIDAMIAAVPFVRTLGIAVPEARLTADRAEVIAVLPDDTRLHNHAAAPHGGAHFSLGITAAVAAVTMVFADEFTRCSPMLARCAITYHRRTKGDLRATATLPRTTTALLADIHNHPEFPVEVTITGPDNTPATTMTTTWTILPASSAQR